MQCKNCGEKMPDPEPRVIVTEKVREINTSDNEAWIRIVRWLSIPATFAIVLGIGSCTANNWIEKEMLDAVIKDPNVRIEIREQPGRSPDRRFTREPVKK